MLACVHEHARMSENVYGLLICDGVYQRVQVCGCPTVCEHHRYSDYSDANHVLTTQLHTNISLRRQACLVNAAIAEITQIALRLPDRENRQP